jgi:hypothetical protein
MKQQQQRGRVEIGGIAQQILGEGLSSRDSKMK